MRGYHKVSVTTITIRRMSRPTASDRL